jgi:hypothetical protein
MHSNVLISKRGKHIVTASMLKRNTDSCLSLALLISQPLFFSNDSIIVVFRNKNKIILKNHFYGQAFPSDGKVYYASEFFLDDTLQSIISTNEIIELLLYKNRSRKEIAKSKKPRFISIKINDKLIISKMLNCFTEKAKK